MATPSKSSSSSSLTYRSCAFINGPKISPSSELILVLASPMSSNNLFKFFMQIYIHIMKNQIYILPSPVLGEHNKQILKT